MNDAISEAMPESRQWSFQVPLVAAPLLGIAGVACALMVPPIQVFLRFFLLLLTFAVTALAVYFGLAGKMRTGALKGSRSVGPILSGVALILVLIAIESFLMLCTRSNSVNYSLAGTLWMERHYKWNSFKYWDVEPDFELAKGKRKLIFLGDSFTLGHGLSDVRERFSNIVAAKLPPTFWTANLGRGGADSVTEFEQMENFPVAPDVLVLQYFGNDIGENARMLGHALPAFTPYEDLPGWVQAVVKHSYLLDWVYWSFPRKDAADWWNYFERMYEEPTVLEAHQKALQRFTDYAEARKIPMVVVLFPYLHNLEASATYRKFVLDFFQSHHVPVLDVLPLVERMPWLDRVVNNNDIHPSAEVNRLVAEQLWLLLQKQGVLPAGDDGARHR